MIFDAVDEDGFAANVLQHASHVGVQSDAEFGVFQKGNAVLRAKGDMQYDAGK